MTFEKLGLSEALLKELAYQKYTKPTPVQEKAIKPILDKKDLLCRSANRFR